MVKRILIFVAVGLLLLALSGCTTLRDTYAELMEEQEKPTCDNNYETFDDYINGC